MSNKIVKSNSMGISMSKDLAYYVIAFDKNDNAKNAPKTKQIKINVIWDNISKSNEMGIDKSKDLAHDAIPLDKAEDDIYATETYDVDLEKVDNKQCLTVFLLS